MSIGLCTLDAEFGSMLQSFWHFGSHFASVHVFYLTSITFEADLAVSLVNVLHKV